MKSIKDVANLAGVSLMTVSRVINNTDGVKPDTREKVLQAIQELDYRPNLVARSLVTRSTKTIGVLYSNIYNQIYSDEIMGIESVASKEGYNIIISNVQDYTSASRGLAMLMDKQVDGLLILPMEFEGIDSLNKWKKAAADTDRFYKELEEMLKSSKNKPCVVFGKDSCKGIANRIFLDYKSGADMAMDYLMSLGFENIVHINSVMKMGIWYDRYVSYVEAMTKKGLEQYIRVEANEATVEGGYNAMKDIIESGKLPEAIFCGNDLMAIGALQSLLENGIRIPNDISVMGHDGLKLGEMLIPKLTTVDINGFEAGASAMRMLLESVDTDQPTRDVYIGQRLIIRNTTKSIQ